MGLCVQGRPGPPDQVVIPVRRAGQEEQARGQVAIAPGGRGVVVVLEDGRAELVVVGVVPLEEHQPPRRVDQRLAGRARPAGRPAPCGRRSSGRGSPPRRSPRSAPGPPSRRRDRFELVDPRVAHLAAAAHRLAEQGEERGVLEHQQPAGLVVAAGLEGEVQGVGRGHRVQRDDPRLAEQQLAGAVEQGVPDRLRGDPAVEQLDDLLAGVVVGARAQRGEQVGRGRRVGLAPGPAVLDPGRALLVVPARGGRPGRRARRGCRPRASAGRRPATAGPARRAASRCTGASDNCWPRRSPCGRSSGSRGRRSGRTARRSRWPRPSGPGDATAASAAASSQSSIAAANASRALRAGGTADSSTGPIVQLPSRTSCACELLK